MARLAALALLLPGIAAAACPDPAGSEPFRMISETTLALVDRSARPLFVYELRDRETGTSVRTEAHEGLFFLASSGLIGPEFTRKTIYKPDPAAFFPAVAGTERRFVLTRVTRLAGEVEDIRESVITYRVIGPTGIEIGTCDYDGVLIEQIPETGPHDTKIVFREVFVSGIGVVANEFTFPDGEMPPERHVFDHITDDPALAVPR